MAVTQVPVGLRPTIWAKQGWRQTLYDSVAGHFLNSGVTFRPSEFEGQATGQELVYNYTRALSTPGIGRGGTMDGNEEALAIGDARMRVGIVRKAVLNPNEDTIEQAETDYDFELMARDALKDFMATQLDYSIFNQLAGNTATTMTLGGITYAGNDLLQVTGQNAIIAPSTDRIIRAGGVANDQSLQPANKMTLTLVDYAVELMLNSNQQMGRLRNGIFGELWISTEQYTDLKQDSDSPITWYNNALAMAAGGDDSALTGKGLFSTSIKPVGTYGGVEIYVNPRVSYGVNSTNNASIPTVRRAVLVGKNALAFASRFGRGRATDTNVPMVFKEQLKDYEYYKGIEARMIYGLKKNTPSNGSDLGTVVIPTYAASHTS